MKAIIFDLYGVLALNGWQAFKAKHFTTREEVWDRVFELSKQVDSGQIPYEDLVRYTAEQTGETEAVVRHEMEHTLPNTKLLNYIATSLKGKYKLGILSNSGKDAVLNIFTSEQRELFDAVVFSHKVGFIKPQRDIYLAITDLLGVEPNECVLVDDQGPHASGGRDVGMHAILYANVLELKENLKDLL